MTRSRTGITASLLAVGLLVTACGDDDSSSATTAPLQPRAPLRPAATTCRAMASPSPR